MVVTNSRSDFDVDPAAVAVVFTAMIRGLIFAFVRLCAGGDGIFTLTRIMVDFNGGLRCPVVLTGKIAYLSGNGLDLHFGAPFGSSAARLAYCGPVALRPAVTDGLPFQGTNSYALPKL